MPTESLGAIGSLNYSSEERKSLAVKSQSWKCPSCGLIKPLLKETSPNSGKTTDSDATREAKELAKQIRFKGTESDTASSKTNSAESIQSPSPSPSNSIGSASIGKDESETIRQRIVAISNNVDTSVHSGVQQNFSQRIEEETTTGINRTTVEQSGTRLSTYCIVVLTVAIAFLLFRRLFL
ncbi:ubiquitin-conjugating enzyme E2 J1-like protein [Leptotrombidium deliense]|uniref:Ubiquitin-conjugating enzyme E2 J1-like protein n=1 Tax=Leptotrombidium deliense TaxID=299467 RepID=A0A443S3I0_9ACAR|nr:ubiquitin-conjugating enzyme E2 J1-like protein [Leptotrombidium deliense]